MKKRTVKQVITDAFQRLWGDIKDAKWAIILIVAYFAFGYRFLYSLCPMIVLTGIPCPGCGLSRAGFCLLRLDFAGAFQMHPFIYAIVIYIVLFAWNRYIRIAQAGRFLKGVLIAILAGMVIFYLWRMILFFPGEPPMNYYAGNLLAKVWRIVRMLAGN